MLELRHLVVGEVDDAQGGVPLEAAQRGDGVVGEVDFFETGEVGEAADVGEAVGLDGEDAEVLEGVEVLGLSDAWFGTWRMEDGGRRTLSSVILFFPSQSSSSAVRLSRF